MMIVMFIVISFFLLAYGKTNIIYNDSQTAGICALAEAFEPTPDLFQGIIDLCSNPEIIIYCNNTYCGVIPPDSGVFSALNLNSKGLSGTIPTEIGLLKNLTIIKMSYNTISGTIPTEIGLLANLAILECYQNALRGTIPSQISKLTLLASLDLGQNTNLAGTIPTQIGLTSLTFLGIINCDLNGTIPTEMGNLSLTNLDLSTNNFWGTIPTELFRHPNLTSLDLSYNNLNGTLPSQIGNLVNLNSLNLRFNKLSGSIPEIGNLTKMVYLVMDNNKFTRLPDSIINLTRLLNAFLYFNPISGTLPTGLSNLKRKTLEFKLYSTEISGTIPTQIGYWTTIGTLNLSKNKLSGTIPTSISNLTSLTFLSLEGNQLSGSIPTVPPSLKTLILSNNQFSDWNCSNLLIQGVLEGLYLANNKLTSIPCQGSPISAIIWPTIIDLDISFNPMPGFPPLLSGGSKISRLKARGLGIKMDLFQFLQRVSYPNLKYLDVSDNHLYDIFSEKILTLVPTIETLILANNSISGTLPDLDGWAFLSSLDISDNNIEGPLPEYYPDVFQSLILTNNKIAGVIPKGLASARALNFLDLSNTSICVDNFPEEWENKIWSACNFQFPWSCSAANIPKHCLLSECVPTTKCFVNQCLGENKCDNGRECIHNEKTWSYSCTECESPFFQNNGLFTCVASYALVLTIIIPIFVASILIMIIYYQIQLKKLNLFLPHNWLWEKSHILKEGYVKSNTDPVYYLKEIDINGNDQSKEVLLFRYLKELLEFEYVPISRVIALSCITLAINLSHYRKITVQRMSSSENVFLNQSWKEKDPVELRQKVRDSFQRQIISFDWNRNLTIENCPIMAVVHATSLNNAKKIIVGGFATLSFVDDGFYGKGMYFSSSASYVIPYGGKTDPCMLICFILPGNPFPVTEQPHGLDSIKGKKLNAGYQSHYVVVNKKGLPFKEKDYINSRRYNEIIVDQEAQIVPIFLVELDSNRKFHQVNNDKSIEHESKHKERSSKTEINDISMRKTDINEEEDISMRRTEIEDTSVVITVNKEDHDESTRKSEANSDDDSESESEATNPYSNE